MNRVVKFVDGQGKKYRITRSTADGLIKFAKQVHAGSTTPIKVSISNGRSTFNYVIEEASCKLCGQELPA